MHVSLKETKKRILYLEQKKFQRFAADSQPDVWRRMYCYRYPLSFYDFFWNNNNVVKLQSMNVYLQK